MKRQFVQLIALLFFAVISINSYAQSNGSFESLTGTNYGSAFASGQVTDWKQSHGTPSIFGGAPGEGLRSAWMWSYHGRGEGIVQNYTFTPGTVYTVNFWVKTNNPDGKFYVQAANGVPNGTSSASTFPSVSSKQTIFSNGLVYNNWKYISVTFTPSTSYAQLWIYPYLAGAPTNGQAEVQVDGIKITACTPMSIAVPNYSFEERKGTDRVRPFSSGLVYGWAQSHGTPSMFGGAPGQGSNSAWMWSYYGRGEGIVTNVNFVAGKTYKVKFWVRTSNPDGAFYVKAANGVPSGTTTSVVIPSVNSQQTIFTDGLNYPKWVEKTVVFTASANFSQLWIYPLLKTAPNNGQAELQVDAIRIETVCGRVPLPIGEEILPIKKTKLTNAQKTLDVKVYPNPTTNQVNVKLADHVEKAEVVLYDMMTGKKVGSFTATQSNNTWMVPASVKAGTYQMVVIDPTTNTRKTTRLVINKK
ncbi:T9SS type A sorting domain-containing protein [Microscilla marina]|uniref:Secretion system C-terminal sorting domain-containing protein n=1 Tax=Microscilla marina ATCC 23134 TaxID=313606 RepID=A1ZYH4_MICM2|nr:T9SS type A sorting domain-containing protein [Microscilla marina]EAY24558.1 hypothetical protein M23134_06961 [Microscilla marina ATCC 23134]